MIKNLNQLRRTLREGTQLEILEKQIKEVHEMGVQIGIVIGGGNIFRGLSGKIGRAHV